jgi:hypothetical protein
LRKLKEIVACRESIKAFGRWSCASFVSVVYGGVPQGAASLGQLTAAAIVLDDTSTAASYPSNCLPTTSTKQQQQQQQGQVVTTAYVQGAAGAAAGTTAEPPAADNVTKSIWRYQAPKVELLEASTVQVC